MADTRTKALDDMMVTPGPGFPGGPFPPMHRVPLFSTMGRGPRGEKGDKGDPAIIEGEVYTKDEVDALMQPEVEVFAPVVDGSAILVKTPKANILFDCGTAAGGPQIASFLNEKGIAHLDAVVITHMHHDHFGGYQSVLEFCDAETDVFIQMEPTSQNSQYSYYSTYVNQLASALTSANLNSAICPVEGSVYAYGDCTCQFYNTNEDNRSVYDSCVANTGQAEDPATWTTSLNNYSLITILRCGDFVYIDAGDLEGEGQRLNAEYMVKANVARTPHHFANWTGYFDWFRKVDPDKWITTWYLLSYRDPDQHYTFMYMAYIWRLLNSGYAKEVWHNQNNAIYLKYKGSLLITVSGDNLQHDTSNGIDGRNKRKNFYDLLPVQYYNENPFNIMYMSIKEIMDANFGYPPISTFIESSSTVASQSRFRRELNKLWHNIGNTRGVFIDIESNKLTAELLHERTRFNKLIIYAGSYTSLTEEEIADESFDLNLVAGIRLINQPTKMVAVDGIELGTDDTWANSGISSDIISAITYANIIGVFVQDGTYTINIPCVAIETDLGSHGRSFSGSLLNTPMTQIYKVYFNTTKIVKCAKVELSTGTVTELKITKITTSL